MPRKLSDGIHTGRDALSRLGTLADWLRYAERRFHRARLAFGHGTDNAFDEAAWLLLNVTKRSYEDLSGALPLVLTAAQRSRALALIGKRIATRKPLAHLLREAWLGEHRFYVDERVIVPRSHIAGLLLQRLAPWISSRAPVRAVLDMCTGSGCLAILAALAFPKASVDAVDISGAALAVARRNVADYRLRGRVRLVRSDLFAEIAASRYDLIVSNPPYVDARALAQLPAEYRREPRLALAAGRDGLEVIRRILVDAVHHLSRNGVLVVEIGSGRRALERAFPKRPFVWLETAAGEGRVFLLTHRQMEGGL